MATIEQDATADQIDEALVEVCQQTTQSLTGDIIYSADKYNLLSIQGALV